MSDTSIEDLPGVGPKAAEKLREAGYVDLMSIAAASSGELIDACEVGAATAEKIIEAARDKLEMGFQTASDVLEKRKNIGKIKTSSEALDELLGGGVETQAITEAHGAFGSGKTQLAFQLAVNVQLPKERGGLNGRCLFIDTEGTFRPDRIVHLAEAKEIDPKKALKNVFVGRAFNSDHQILLAEKAKDMIRDQNIKLMIIDSLTSQFRSDYTGRGELAPRQQKLNRHMHTLIKLSEIYNVAIYVTNQVMARPDILFGDPTIAIGGHIVGHACLPGDTLIQLADGTIKQIKDVHQEELVSANFNNMKFEKKPSDITFVNNSIGEIYEIDTGSRIRASPLHKFFRLNGLKIDEVQARQLKEGDWILHAGKLSAETSMQNIPEIDMDEFVTITEEGSSIIKDVLQSEGTGRCDVCNAIGINERHFRRILNQGYSTKTSVVHSLITEAGIPASIMEHTEPYESYKHRSISLPSVFNAEMATIFGYFLGDGNLEKRSLRFTEQRKEILEHYNEIIKYLFGISGKIKRVKGRDCFKLSVNSIHMMKMFKTMKENYMELVSKSPDHVVSAFIRGFADAEACVSKERPRITIAQKNVQTIKLIQMLLLRFDIRSAIWNGKRSYRLMIDGKDIVKFHSKIGITARDKALLLEKWSEHCEKTYTREHYPIKRKVIWNMLSDSGLRPSCYMRTRPDSYKYIHRKELQKAANALLKTKYKEAAGFMLNLLNGDLRVGKIRKIRKLPNSEALYDISVPENENYIANGFVVHNSTYRLYLRRSKQDTRIARLIDAPNLPAGEAIFTVSESGLGDKGKK